MIRLAFCEEKTLPACPQCAERVLHPSSVKIRGNSVGICSVCGRLYPFGPDHRCLPTFMSPDRGALVHRVEVWHCHTSSLENFWSRARSVLSRPHAAKRWPAASLDRIDCAQRGWQWLKWQDLPFGHEGRKGRVSADLSG
jgi:hypothetical protein